MDVSRTEDYEFLPIDLFDYTRVGGSVSHSAFDLAIEFGFSKIALVGQDLALSETGNLYTNSAELDSSAARMANLGVEFKVEGFYGEDVTTNSSFSYFAQFYKYFAKQVNAETDTKLFNCTEGGIYLEGFDHISLKSFIDEEVVIRAKNSIDRYLLQ